MNQEVQCLWWPGKDHAFASKCTPKTVQQFICVSHLVTNLNMVEAKVVFHEEITLKSGATMNFAELA